AFENLVGKSADVLMNTSLIMLFPSDLRQHAMRIFETTLAGVRLNAVEIPVQHQDGSVRTVVWNSATIFSQDGTIPVATIAQGQDVTIRRTLERKNEISLIQIQKNLAQLSILNDEIRSSLSLILTCTDMIDDKAVTTLIEDQIRRIDKMVSQLDKRWIESEKVLDMIRKNYQIHISPYQNQDGSHVPDTRYQSDHPDVTNGSTAAFSPLHQEIEAELYTILDSIDAIIYVADLTTHELLYLNKPGRSIFGDYAGKFCYQVIEQDLSGPCQHCIQDLPASGTLPHASQQVHKNSRNNRWYDCRGRIIRWNDGRDVVLQVATDITKRKNAENMVREKERTFQAVFENSQDAILLIKGDRLIDCNQATLDLLLISEKELVIGSIPLDFSPILQPDGRQSDIAADEYIARAHREGHCRFEWQIARTDGQYVIVEVSLISIMVEGESMLYSTWRDITVRKQAEEALYESEQFVRTLFTKSPISLTLVSVPDATFIEVNDAFIRNTGFSRDEVIGKTSEELTLFTDYKQYQQMVGSLQNQQAFLCSEMSVRNASGEIRICRFLSKIIMMKGRPYILSSAEDVTEKTWSDGATRALVRSMVSTTGINSLDTITATLSSFLGADCVMIGRIQPDNSTVQVISMILDGEPVTDYAYTLANTPCEGVSEKGFCQFDDHVQELFPDSRDLADMNIRGYVGTPIRDSDHMVIGILCLLFRKPIRQFLPIREIMDIIAVKASAEIQRTEIEQKLIENQILLTQAMDLASLVYWEYDVPADQITFNDRFYELYGTSAQREGGYQMSSARYAQEFVHPEDLHVVEEEVKRPLDTSYPAYTSQQEHRIIRRDGEVRTILVRIAIIKDAQGVTIKTRGVNQDITERKKLENAIRKVNQKLNLLTAITRHDILNKLSVIHAFVDLSEKDLQNPRLPEYLTLIHTISDEIQSQIEFTRIYDEIGSQDPLWIEMDTIIPRSMIPAGISMEAHVEGISVFADPLLKKVFYNLLDNSIRHGQQVTRIRVTAREEGGMLVIRWEDNGVGIPAVMKKSIFEQGFGTNTGQGLFLVREILSLTDIVIRETGIPGEGARFELQVLQGAYRITGDPGRLMD
ncbi:MAG: PAS domain S-box protein, partial [Methanobacteriota archaeon]